jgi:HlyD family secretion protein
VKFTKTLLAQTQARVDALTSERSNARTSLEKATQELQAAQLEITAAQGEIAQAEAALQKLRQRPDAPSPPIVTPPVTSSTNEERVAAQAAVRAAELNVGQARVAFEQSEAARARAQTDFALADKDFLRGQKLFDAGAVSRRFFESKQELHAAAQKKLEQTTEQWKERRTRLAQAEETLKQAQNRLHQARTQEPAPPVETNPQTTVRNPPSSDVAEVAAVVKQARERAAHAAARAKASREVYETAQQRVAEVEATWQALTQQVTDAQETLSNKAVLVGAADIHAPCDGVVTQIAAQVGDKVTAGTPLVFVAPPDKWRARFSLSLEATLLIKPQMTVPVALPLADGRTKEFVGTVERVIPLESVTAISVADVLITTEGASVQVDASATCALSLGQREDVLTVPAEAVHQDGEKTTVYIVQSQGAKHVAQMREVRLGWTDGSRYEVVDGLSAGEQVVIESASLLHEGDVVRIE